LKPSNGHPFRNTPILQYSNFQAFEYFIDSLMTNTDPLG
jgi:hypothetical protein